MPRIPVTLDVVSLAGRGWRHNRALTLLIGAMLAFLAVTLTGLVFDQRTITGAPAWLKPTKFALSIAIYATTLIWLLTYVEGRGARYVWCRG